MIYLNDKYAYDGRDASSYANFLWCFGLHDRPFPLRSVFGAMRPMSSASAGRKARGAGYMQRRRTQQRDAHPGPRAPQG
jgi:deoxyribodipyrimidine photo-lyase